MYCVIRQMPRKEEEGAGEEGTEGGACAGQPHMQLVQGSVVTPTSLFTRPHPPTRPCLGDKPHSLSPAWGQPVHRTVHRE